MICSDADKLLSSFIDDELDATIKQEVAEHLDECAVCSQGLKLFRRTKQVVKDRVPVIHASESLKHRIQVNLNSIESTEPKLSRWFSRLCSNGPRPILIGAGLFLIVFLIVLFTTVIGQPPSLLAEVYAHHLDFYEVPYQIEATNGTDIDGWLSDNINVPVSIPSFAEQHYNLLGGTICTLCKKQRPWIRYTNDTDTLSLFVCKDLDLAEINGKKAIIAGQEVQLVSLKQGSIAFWQSSNNIAMVLVSSQSADQLTGLVQQVLTIEP